MPFEGRFTHFREPNPRKATQVITRVRALFPEGNYASRGKNLEVFRKIGVAELQSIADY